MVGLCIGPLEVLCFLEDSVTGTDWGWLEVEVFESLSRRSDRLREDPSGPGTLESFPMLELLLIMVSEALLDELVFVREVSCLPPFFPFLVLLEAMVEMAGGELLKNCALKTHDAGTSNLLVN